VAILITAALKLLLAITGTFIYALTLSTIIRLSYFALTCAALPVLRRRDGNAASELPVAQFRIPRVGWVVAIVAVSLCGWLLSNSSGRELRDVLIGGGLGLVIFRAMQRSQTNA
jgi:amino acid transporter